MRRQEIILLEGCSVLARHRSDRYSFAGPRGKPLEYARHLLLLPRVLSVGICAGSSISRPAIAMCCSSVKRTVSFRSGYVLSFAGCRIEMTTCADLRLPEKSTKVVSVLATMEDVGHHYVLRNDHCGLQLDVRCGPQPGYQEGRHPEAHGYAVIFSARLVVVRQSRKRASTTWVKMLWISVWLPKSCRVSAQYSKVLVRVRRCQLFLSPSLRIPSIYGRLLRRSFLLRLRRISSQYWN